MSGFVAPPFSVWDPGGALLLSSIYVTPVDWHGCVSAVSLERYDSDRSRRLWGVSELAAEACAVG